MDESAKIYDAVEAKIKGAKDSSALEEIGREILETNIMMDRQKISLVWTNRCLHFGIDPDDHPVTVYLDE